MSFWTVQTLVLGRWPKLMIKKDSLSKLSLWKKWNLLLKIYFFWISRMEKLTVEKQSTSTSPDTVCKQDSNWCTLNSWIDIDIKMQASIEKDEDSQTKLLMGSFIKYIQALQTSNNYWRSQHNISVTPSSVMSFAKEHLRPIKLHFKSKSGQWDPQLTK